MHVMGRDDIYPVKMSEVGCHGRFLRPSSGVLKTVLAATGATAVATNLGHLYWIYIIPTHDMHQWLLIQFLVLLMRDAENVRNM